MNREKILLMMRFGIVLATFLWWWFTSEAPLGIALILVLSCTTLIRVQFTNSPILILVEVVVCFLATQIWPGAIFALLLPSFEAGLLGPLFMIFPILGLLLTKTADYELGLILTLNLFAFSSGTILRGWGQRENGFLTAADRERKQRYEVEQLKNELLVANTEVADLVETTERNRIAQQLHDNVGHELAGAHIALQTYKKLKESSDVRADEMLNLVLKRVENSTVKLRETVYQLRPSIEGGALRLQKLCEEFTFCPINYQLIGDKDRVPAMAWVLLEPCLKEALTNVTKYSKATEVDVHFDITQYIIRLYVKDNGIGSTKITSGLGLFGIRERIRAAGGTVSVDGSNGFMITCILPIDNY